MAKERDASRDYIDKERMNKELADYSNAHRAAKANSTQFPRMSEYLGHCILEIARHKIRQFNYVGYSYREDMVSAAVCIVVQYVHSYNPEKETRTGTPNSFGYVSFAVERAFKNILSDEAFQSYYKLKSYEKMIEMYGHDVLHVDEGSNLDSDIDMSQTAMFDDYAIKIYSFEQKIEAKKQRQKDKYRARNPKKVKIGISNFFSDNEMIEDGVEANLCSSEDILQEEIKDD